MIRAVIVEDDDKWAGIFQKGAESGKRLVNVAA